MARSPCPYHCDPRDQPFAEFVRPSCSRRPLFSLCQNCRAYRGARRPRNRAGMLTPTARVSEHHLDEAVLEQEIDVHSYSHCRCASRSSLWGFFFGPAPTHTHAFTHTFTHTFTFTHKHTHTHTQVELEEQLRGVAAGRAELEA